jgi:hypothetical protein
VNKKLLISGLVLLTNSTILPAQWSCHGMKDALPTQSIYHIIKMENLLSENPIMSIHNGKQGCNVLEFSPKNVRLKMGEQRYSLQDLIDFIKKGPQILPETERVVIPEVIEYFFGDTQKLQNFQYSHCILVHWVEEEKCKLTRGVEFSNDSADRANEC